MAGTNWNKPIYSIRKSGTGRYKIYLVYRHVGNPQRTTLVKNFNTKARATAYVRSRRR